MTTHKNKTKETQIGFVASNKDTVTTIEPKGDSLAALRAQLSRDMAGYHWHTSQDMFEEYTKKGVNFVVAKNGVFRVTVNRIGVFASRLIESKVPLNVPGLIDLKEGVTLRLPKIPFEHWLKVLTFYRDVHTKDGTEASILFFWNHNKIVIPRMYESGKVINGVFEDGQLVIICPEQKNSSSLSEFHMDGMVNWLRENTTPLLETHSHHTMGAFWSATDNQNENMTQFYGVYGNIKDAAPKFLFRYVHGADKTDIPMWELFEKPNVVTVSHVHLGDTILEVEAKGEYHGPWPAVQYPDDWMGQHSKSVYVPPTYAGHNGGYGNGFGGVYPRQGAQTSPQNYGAHQGAGSYHSADTEDAAYGGHYAGHSRHKAGAQVLDIGGKKNILDGKTDDNLTRGIAVRRTVETSTSTVKIVCKEQMSPWAMTEIEGIVKALCKGGYDSFMANLVQKLEAIG